MISNINVQRGMLKKENKVMSDDLKVWKSQSILIVSVSFLTDVCP